VKYLALLTLLIHISNSIRDRTKLHRCSLLSHNEGAVWMTDGQTVA